MGDFSKLASLKETVVFFLSFHNVSLIFEHVIKSTDVWCKSQKALLCFKIKQSDWVKVSV